MTSAPQNPRGQTNATATTTPGAAPSFATATEKSAAQPAVSGTAHPGVSESDAVPAPQPQHGQSPSTSTVNGKPSMQQNPPPVAGGPTIVNGNTQAGDHGRKPSVTISAAGATGYMPNGRPMSGPTGRPDNLQFGSLDTQGSSPMANSDAQNQQQQQNLGVAPAANNRVTSPDASPSPIPQPMVSGGRPPSSLQGQGNNLNFGPPSGDQGDMNRSMRPVPQGPMGSNPPQSNHFRRESTHSAHSDMSGHNLPGPPNRGGYGGHGGRNRSYGQPHHQSQMGGYNPSGPYRSASNQHRGGPHMGHQYSQRSVGYANPAARSPAMANVNPATPPVNPVPMANPQMQQPYSGPYPPHMGGQQGYMPPNYDYYYQSGYQMPQMGGYMAPSSPRPPFAPGAPQPPYMQQQYSNPGVPGSQATPLSREPSQVSDRPGSSLSQHHPPPPPTTQGHHAHHASQPSHSPSQFSAPKKSGVVIRDPNGNPVTFPKASASPARASPSPVKVNATPTSTPTPPPPAQASGPARVPSRGEQDQTENKPQTESKPQVEGKSQSGEEKKQDFRDAIARAAESAKKEAEEKKVLESKPQKESDEADKKEVTPAKEEAAPAAAPASEKETPKEPEAPAKEEAKTPEPAKPAADDEIDIDAIERELAEKEAAEEEAERAYQEKKRKEKEEKERKEKEEAAAFEANLKNAEREAEAREEERMKKLESQAQGSPSTERPDALASLRAKDAASPVSTEGAATRTPAESGAATPVSDTSTGTPQKAASAAKQKPAALKLETAKTVEPPQPSAAMKSLQTARFLKDPTAISYPSSVSAPDATLNANASADRKLKYNLQFLLQFQNVVKEKPFLDWDSRVKETVGDSSTDSARPSPRVQSTGGRGSSARPGVPGGFPGGAAMGAFGQTHGKPQAIAAGGQDRFPVAMGGRPGAMGGGGPFGQLPRGGMGSGMARTASAGPLQQPNSPRTGSHRGTRTGSKRDKSGKKEEESNKSMPLTASGNIEPLAVSTSGWKPRSVGRSNLAGPAPGGDGHLPPEVVQGKVKSNLNKMTPEKFDRIADQILAIVAQSKDESDGRTLRQVIQLTFEKATDEAHWAPMYAKFCMRMLESMSQDIKDENIRDKQGQVVTGGSLFRKYLLNRCQEEFERGWKVNLPEKPDGVTEEVAMMSDEYYKAAAAKRRGLGLVRFIGELYKLGMLTERIMHECVKKLVDYDGTPDEAEIESLVSLLRTIGMALDNSEKGRSMMDAYFGRIQIILESTEISSRHKFMLMDIIDLRKAGWNSKDTDKGPKTINEIREAAARAQQEQEMEKMRQQANRGGGGRPQMGRGDARNISGYANQPPPDYASSKVGTDDLRRLKTTRGAQPPTMSFGPPSMFGSRSSSSGRRNQGGPGGNLVRGGEDSGASSRTGTPPAASKDSKKDDKEAASSANAFSALAGLDAEKENVAGSPPSAQSTPSMMKSRPAAPQSSDKSEGAGGST